jgi:hypothetical protein
MKRPDESLRDIDKECQSREGPNRGKAPARAKPEEERHDQEQEEGGERDDEV